MSEIKDRMDLRLEPILRFRPSINGWGDSLYFVDSNNRITKWIKEIDIEEWR